MNKFFVLTALLFLAGPTLITYSGDSTYYSTDDDATNYSESDYDSNGDPERHHHRLVGKIKHLETKFDNLTHHFDDQRRFRATADQKVTELTELNAKLEGRLRKRTPRSPNPHKSTPTQKKMHAVNFMGQEAVYQELLQRCFSKSISQSLSKTSYPSLLDGNDAAALLATVGATAQLIHFNSTHPTLGADEIAVKTIAGDLATVLTGKYLARKSVNVAISATNWCYRKFSDNKDLVDVVKHEYAINRVKDFTGLVGSAASKSIVSCIADGVQNFGSRNEKKHIGPKKDHTH